MWRSRSRCLFLSTTFAKASLSFLISLVSSKSNLSTLHITIDEAEDGDDDDDKADKSADDDDVVVAGAGTTAFCCETLLLVTVASGGLVDKTCC